MRRREPRRSPSPPARHTLEADIIKKKQPQNNGGFVALDFGRTNPAVYDELTTEHPIDLTRWRFANRYLGRVSLINSGGASSGEDDLVDVVRMVHRQACRREGLITGRKAFQRTAAEGIALLHAVQCVYLDASITVAKFARRRRQPGPTGA